jgi:hypothetical protein
MDLEFEARMLEAISNIDKVLLENQYPFSKLPNRYNNRPLGIGVEGLKAEWERLQSLYNSHT